MAGNNLPVPLESVRDGEVISYPGPVRRHGVAKALGLGSSHIGIAARVDGVLCVIEVGPSGCRARPIDEVLDRFREVEVLALPIDDDVRDAMADLARDRLGTRTWYAPGLARLTYLWANLRAVDHYAIPTLVRLLHPVAAGLAAVLGCRRTTCSSFVHEVAHHSGAAAAIGLRFDQPAGILPAARYHRRSLSHLCAPSDYWRSPVVTRRPIVASSPLRATA